ncbi:pyridoxamine kinase [Pelosinus propionicus]|uniref:pyridoxal kinase n=1 Tax=Pelosinus propionicus DSM 13327 TaxID=1123291 RepID=A0A1I4MMR2_9FIRM|nr:pyridoxamine kinase [Pelosinus propionicus]SFM04316.1 pyridoxine kinase [Pelosinus propionicus DSM 13327]
MRNYVPKVAAVHDISCFGRCSLTVISPVLSAMGIQVCPLPTAVLSTHLGGFKELAFCDFTSHMPNFFHHWKKEGINFHCIYSGFLASEEQIDIVQHFIDEFSSNHPLVVVDPVMGDDGKLYSIYTPRMQERMRDLVRKADIVTPNYTEACFLLGESYQDKIDDTKKMKNWLLDLADFGPSKVVITGIPYVNNKILTLGYDRSQDTFCEVYSDYIPAKYPGTGDIFASVLVGALLQQDCLSAAMEQAAEFVRLSIQTTFAAQTPPREGVLVEKVLPWLCRETQPKD